MKKLILLTSILIGFKSFAQTTENYKYKGTIGSMQIELSMVVNVSKDGCNLAFNGTYDHKKLKKQIEIVGEFNACENDITNPDAPTILKEMDGDKQIGIFTLTSLGEPISTGNWTTPDGKKKLSVKLLLQDGSKKK
jgi:hypothetical protein